MIKLVRQYSVFLPDTPGAMSKFLARFYNEGLNIIGIAAESRAEAGVVRITVDSETPISQLLTGDGFTTIESQLILLELADRPGMLLRLSELLGAAGISITTAYGTTYTGSIGHLLLGVTDTERAMELLREFLAGQPADGPSAA